MANCCVNMKILAGKMFKQKVVSIQAMRMFLKCNVWGEFVAVKSTASITVKVFKMGKVFSKCTSHSLRCCIVTS